MIGKKPINFLSMFYRLLWLLQRYLCPTSIKSWLLNLEFVEVQTGQVFEISFWGNKLIIWNFVSKFKLYFYWPIQYLKKLFWKNEVTFKKGFPFNFQSKRLTVSLLEKGWSANYITAYWNILLLKYFKITLLW